MRTGLLKLAQEIKTLNSIEAGIFLFRDMEGEKNGKEDRIRHLNLIVSFCVEEEYATDQACD